MTKRTNYRDLPLLDRVRPHCEAWDRLLGESVLAFDSFIAYRDMGVERSLRKVAKQIGKSISLIARFSHEQLWVDRVSLYQQHLDRILQAKNAELFVKANERHAMIAQQFQAKVTTRILELDPNEIPVGHLERVLRTAVEIELQALGRPQKTTQVLNRISADGEGDGKRVVFVFDDSLLPSSDTDDTDDTEAPAVREK